MSSDFRYPEKISRRDLILEMIAKVVVLVA